MQQSFHPPLMGDACSLHLPVELSLLFDLPKEGERNSAYSLVGQTREEPIQRVSEGIQGDRAIRLLAGSYVVDLTLQRQAFRAHRPVSVYHARIFGIRVQGHYFQG